MRAKAAAHSSLTRERRLSPWRVLAALVILAVSAGGALYGYRWWAGAQAAEPVRPWFAGYADVTATPSFPFESPRGKSGRGVMLAFIVADPADGCTPSWGAVYSLDAAGEQLDLDRRLARLSQQGGEYAISFGGLLNDELATACTDPARLAEAYRAVIERYEISTIDLDIEADDLADTEAGERRAAVLAGIQKQRRARGEDLAIWMTLPAATFGMTQEGASAVAQALAAGVDLAGVNVMTMDYGASRADDQSMADASISALTAAHRQVKAIYRRAGLPLSDASVWSKLGATPMIGQNDVPGEVLSLKDARRLNRFAAEVRLGRMSMWSLNRDATCGPNYPDITQVSDGCSGVRQGDVLFADVLARHFSGSLSGAAGSVTETQQPEDLTDDPETSPYPIWSEEAAYLEGTKVVWHRSVYRAKWWTSGDLPDNPVLMDWETPWELIGPVLPGEEPLAVPTLPPGLYPEWTGTDAYEKAERVLFDGIPYQAKWWNQGESPEAASSDPAGSPWAPLTDEQVREVRERDDAD